MVKAYTCEKLSYDITGTITRGMHALVTAIFVVSCPTNATVTRQSSNLSIEIVVHCSPVKQPRTLPNFFSHIPCVIYILIWCLRATMLLKS